jgi:soluble lytic murein transglycosylase
MTFFQQMHRKHDRYRRHTGEYRFEKVFSLVSLVCLLFALFSFIPLLRSVAEAGVQGAGYADSVAGLGKAKDLLERGRYDEAVEGLRNAYAQLPVVGDYALLFMAQAYNGLEKFDESSQSVSELLNAYPDSPLKRKARAMQVNNLFLARDVTRQNQGSRADGFPGSLPPQRIEDALRYLEAYVADYPDDTEMSFFYARFLKKLERTDRAKKMFVRIYVGNTPFAELALQELRPSDITPEDMLAKASTLMKAFEHKKAEAVLRKILPAAREPLREEVLKNLGQSLFRQKRYREAGETFLKAGDVYNAARSLYRAGDLGTFRETVARLISMDDKRAGSLLVVYAAKKRRDGKTDEAIDVYEDVKKKYPSLTEDALWGIAWSSYRNGDYGKAKEILATLADRYPSSRYSYWRQRTAERSMPLDASDDRGENMPERPQADRTVTLPDSKAVGGDFYRTLAYVRNMDNFSGRPVPVSKASWTRSLRGWPGDGQTVMEAQQLPRDLRPFYERFSILMELGLKEDAIGELVRMSNKTTKPDLLASLCRVLQGAGAYKRAINVISRFSDEKGLKWGDGATAQILYPLAYWPTVSEISDRYSLDPFLLLAVMREESRFDPKARSIAGALGLMQIMPQTAYSLDKQIRIDIADDSAIYDIRTNVTVGAYYLNSLLKEFGSLPLALAAYNAGHDKVRDWVKEGGYRSSDEFVEDIPYDETRNYVKRVLLTYLTYLSLGDRQERGN